MGRSIIWITEPSFRGWACSECEWHEPVPTLLASAEAKSAYDRLAQGKFRQHDCANFLSRLKLARPESFTDRIRKLVVQGFKPKDAVEIFLQEVMLEHRDQPKVLEQARSDAEDFLRRVREGLI